MGYSACFTRKLGLGEAFRSRLQSSVERRYGVRWDELELPRSVESIGAPARDGWPAFPGPAPLL